MKIMGIGNHIFYIFITPMAILATFAVAGLLFMPF